MKEPTDFWVGDRFVRPSLGEIQLGPERVHLEPRSMEVLQALVARPGEVFAKKELIDTVWGDTFVQDEVLTHAIWDLRRALGDRASDPEFIQTIPKKGYRLIAPVKPVEEPRRRATDRSASSIPKLAAVLAAIAAVIALGLWLARNPRTAEPARGTAAVDQSAEPVVPPPATPAGPPVALALLLVSAGEPAGAKLLGPRLDRHISSNLIGLPGDVVVRTGPSCSNVSTAKSTYCLEPTINPQSEGHEINVTLSDAATGAPSYSTPVRQLTSGADLEPIATEIADLVTAYFEVEQDSYSRDPDIEPWLLRHRHDPRAVKLFLLGMKYAYRHERGAGDPMADAMRLDPDFVAPWVWRAPAVAARGTEEAKADHKKNLGRLKEEATGFERPMIDWAQAIIDHKFEEATRHLWIAEKQAPGNRPVLHVLGALLARLEDLEAAWQILDGLLATGWEFPGLYPLAAHCALLRGELGDFSRALSLGEAIQPIDPETLAQLRLLALYEDNVEGAEIYGDRLAKRKLQMKPETVQLEFEKPAAELLAARAEAEGKTGIAAALREFAN